MNRLEASEIQFWKLLLDEPGFNRFLIENSLIVEAESISLMGLSCTNRMCDSLGEIFLT